MAIGRVTVITIRGEQTNLATLCVHEHVYTYSRLTRIRLLGSLLHSLFEDISKVPQAGLRLFLMTLCGRKSENATWKRKICQSRQCHESDVTSKKPAVLTTSTCRYISVL